MDSTAPVKTAKQSLKVLIIVNDMKVFAGAMNFLSKHEYEVQSTDDIEAALRLVVSFEPQITLLSWNLKKANIKKMTHLIQAKFKCPVIVFAEDDTANTAASILRSGISHILLAPISGPAMH